MWYLDRSTNEILNQLGESVGPICFTGSPAGASYQASVSASEATGASVTLQWAGGCIQRIFSNASDPGEHTIEFQYQTFGAGCVATTVTRTETFCVPDLITGWPE